MSALPYSIEAEQSVLGALMLDARAFDAVGAKLKAESFADARHRPIWDAIAASVIADKPTDPVSLWELLNERQLHEIAGGMAYLHALAGCVPTARNVERHAEIVADRFLQREIIIATERARELAVEPGPVAQKLDAIAALFSTIERGTMSKRPRLLADVMLQRTEAYEELASGKRVAGWSTGFPQLDRRLGGGLKAGKLIILAARPSVGKSSFSMNILTNVGRVGHVCMFLSQEMEVEEIADRAASSMGHVDQDHIQTGRLSESEWTGITEAHQTASGMQVYVDDQPALTLTDVRAKARSIKGLKVMVLDYLQLCSSSITSENRNAQIEEISRGLKSLAKQLGICIVALSQLNRQVEMRAGKRPQLSDLRDSGAIEQDADAVLFLWPLKVSDSAEVRVIGLDAAKVRGGRTGAFALNFDGSRQRWTESTESVDSFVPTAPKQKGGFE